MRRLVFHPHAARRAAGGARSTSLARPRADSRILLRLAAACAYISGITAAVGVVLLVAQLGLMVAAPADDQTLYGLGEAHAACLLLQYGFAIPIALVLHGQNRSVAADRSLAVTVLALIGLTNIVEMQALILGGLFESHQQIVYLLGAFGVLAVWFLTVGWLGRLSGLLAGRTVLLGFLGASYVAYPVWAFWLARQLRERGAVHRQTA